MGMGVDETRREHMIRSFNHNAWLVSIPGLSQRQQVDNLAIVDDNGVVEQHRAGGVDGNAPARRYQGVTVLHYRRSIRVAQGSVSRTFQVLPVAGNTAVYGPAVVSYGP